MRCRTSRSLAALFVITGFAWSCGDSTAPEKSGPPTDIAVSAGNHQTGRVAGVLAAPLAVKVTDAKGRGVPNVDVSFQVMLGGGSVSPLTARSNGAGIATTSWTLPETAGDAWSVRAVAIDTLTGALIDSVSFSATVVGDVPAFWTQGFAPALAPTGSTVGPLAVTLFDRFGNRSPGAVVHWAVTAGAGTLSAPTSTSGPDGTAQVMLTLGAAAGVNTVRATYGTMTVDFTVEGRVAGKPTTINIVFPPQSAPTGSVLPLKAGVLDGLGHPVVGATVTWTVLAGGGALEAPTSLTDVDGIATIKYTVGSEPGRNTVQARVADLTATASIEGRLLADRLAYVDGSAFGIARTAGGRFLVSLIQNGAVATFTESAPQTVQSITTGGIPVVVAVDAAGTFAYVSNIDGWMDIIDIASRTVVKKVTVASAHALALSPAGDRVYVTSRDGWVYSVSTASRVVTDSVAIPFGPWGIAFRSTSTDSLMYVTSRDGGSVTEVDTKTMTVRRDFNVGGRPHGLVITQDGTTLYAADNTEGKVKVIDIASGTVTASVALAGAFGIAISPDDNTLYVTTDVGPIAVIDAHTLTVSKRIDTDREARQIMSSPDGSVAWAADEGGWVDVVRR